jgi:hypothetical protein
MADLVVKDLVALLDYARDRTVKRLEGLTDAEFFWEPDPDTFTVRRDAASGKFRADAVPREDPVPAPVATIAWRMWHIGADCLRHYRKGFFGVDLGDVDWQVWPGTAADATRQLEADWTAFRDDVAGFDDDRLLAKMGPRARAYADDTYLALVLHAVDEVVHHSAEIGLLRDLYLRRPEG